MNLKSVNSKSRPKKVDSSLGKRKEYTLETYKSNEDWENININDNIKKLALTHKQNLKLELKMANNDTQVHKRVISSHKKEENKVTNGNAKFLKTEKIDGLQQKNKTRKDTKFNYRVVDLFNHDLKRKKDDKSKSRPKK